MTHVYVDKHWKQATKIILKKYGLSIILILFLSNIGLLYAVHMLSSAKTCFTTAQVTSDARCLYILNSHVYEKGTRSKPHKGHTCGMDVTSIIPSFHLSNAAKYLDPDYIGDICTVTTIPTNTPIPPTATPRPSATGTPVPTTTATRVPTQTPRPSPTSIPTTIPSLTPLPTVTKTPIPTPTTTRIPNIGGPNPTNIITPTAKPTATPRPIPTSTPSRVPSNTPVQQNGSSPTITQQPLIPTETSVVEPTIDTPTLTQSTAAPECTLPFQVQNVRIICPLCGQ